jgi:hypothetical protein
LIPELTWVQVIGQEVLREAALVIEKMPAEAKEKTCWNRILALAMHVRKVVRIAWMPAAVSSEGS